MNNSSLNFQSIKKLNEAGLDPATKFRSVVSNPKLFGSNDAYELEIQLRQIRSILADCINNLELIDYDFNEVVDKDQFNSLRNNYSFEKKLYNSLQQDLSLMEQDILKLEKLESKLISEINKLEKRTEKSHRNLTPRPDWNKCIYLNNKEKKSKSTNSLMKILINQLTLVSKNSTENYSDSSGSEYESEKKFNLTENLGEKYLFVTHRQNSDSVHQVFNRKLNRSELEFVINELIVSKIDNDYLLSLNRTTERKMSRFALQYFQSKFKCKELAFEWLVNIKESCGRFSDLKSAKFMGLVLDDQADENAQIKFYASIGSFYYNLIQNINESDMELGALNSLIKTTFKNKNNIYINELSSCLKNEKYLWEDSKINLFRLSDFLTCSDSKFLTKLRHQFEAEEMKQFHNIVGLLKAKNEKTVCQEDFFSCIKEIDTENEIEKYSRQIFSDPKIMRLDFPEFEVRLKKFFLISLN